MNDDKKRLDRYYNNLECKVKYLTSIFLITLKFLKVISFAITLIQLFSEKFGRNLNSMKSLQVWKIWSLQSVIIKKAARLQHTSSDLLE
mgnify:CR=1 FL=1